MPDPDDASHEALERLDRRLGAFEASRQAKAPIVGLGGEAGAGYRLLGQMLGGVFGGLGFGWLFDSVVHTSPWGLLAGLGIGTVLSIWSVMRSASAGAPPGVGKDGDGLK